MPRHYLLFISSFPFPVKNIPCLLAVFLV